MLSWINSESWMRKDAFQKRFDCLPISPRESLSKVKQRVTYHSSATSRVLGMRDLHLLFPDRSALPRTNRNAAIVAVSTESLFEFSGPRKVTSLTQIHKTSTDLLPLGRLTMQENKCSSGVRKLRVEMNDTKSDVFPFKLYSPTDDKHWN